MTITLAACLAFLASCSRSGAPATPTTQAGAGEVTRSDSYYPLAVGNYWVYTCSTEGESVVRKEVRIVGRQQVGSTVFYRVEQKSTDTPFVYYLFQDPQGRILRSMDSPDVSDEKRMT